MTTQRRQGRNYWWKSIYLFSCRSIGGIISWWISRNSILSINNDFMTEMLTLTLRMLNMLMVRVHTSYAIPHYVSLSVRNTAVSRAGSEPNVSVKVNEWFRESNQCGVILTNFKHLVLHPITRQTAHRIYNYSRWFDKHFYFCFVKSCLLGLDNWKNQEITTKLTDLFV